MMDILIGLTNKKSISLSNMNVCLRKDTKQLNSCQSLAEVSEVSQLLCTSKSKVGKAAENTILNDHLQLMLQMIGHRHKCRRLKSFF